MQVRPGEAYPLGATYDGAGTNVAVFTEAADRVELCLLHDDGTRTRVELRESDAFLRARLRARGDAASALRVPGARTVHPGARPAVQSGEAAARSVRPCAQRSVRWNEAVYGHRFDAPSGATTWTRRPAR